MIGSVYTINGTDFFAATEVQPGKHRAAEIIKRLFIFVYINLGFL